MLAKTPKPPYYAVIFSSIKTTDDDPAYEKMASRMLKLVQLQDGFLGLESARSELGITVSYWRDIDAIRKWKAHFEHLLAQQMGKSQWYLHYKTRIARVEHDYEFELNTENIQP